MYGTTIEPERSDVLLPTQQSIGPAEFARAAAASGALDRAGKMRRKEAMKKFTDDQRLRSYSVPRPSDGARKFTAFEYASRIAMLLASLAFIVTIGTIFIAASIRLVR